MTTSRADVTAELRRIAAEHLEGVDLDAMGESARLVEDLELDSMQLVTLSFEVEDFFEIILEPEDESAIETVGDLADTIVRLRVVGDQNPEDERR